ncbi:MAG: GNAT family N-acetyltransferase [Gammaproteobacteria bacterium]
MPVVLRDVRHSTRSREWFARAQSSWLVEIGASAEDVAAAASNAMAMLSRSDREVILIERDGESVGFAVLQRCDAPSIHVLLEFYIAPPSRALGVGASAARLLFDRFSGAWEIRSLANDIRAITFWRRVTGRHALGAVEEQRERGEIVQRFLSRGAR